MKSRFLLPSLRLSAFTKRISLVKETIHFYVFCYYHHVLKGVPRCRKDAVGYFPLYLTYGGNAGFIGGNH